MRTKIIPFDLEIAKKIQSGEIEGRIVTTEGNSVRIICFDRKGFADKIIGLVAIDAQSEYGYELEMSYREDGSSSKQSRYDLFIELPEETPICNNPDSPKCKTCSNWHCNDCQYNKHEFKLFDKVLVRNKNNEKWHQSLYTNTDGFLYYTINCKSWKQCIPYEGNQELVGTTNNPG